jgi:signal transduction histidine kinase
MCTTREDIQEHRLPVYASAVSIEPGERDTEYWLGAADNGNGFDVAKQPSGFGTSGRQQRIEAEK